MKTAARRFLLAAATLSLGATTFSAAFAMEGGALARERDRLARATVSFTTLAVRSGQVNINYCSGVLIARNVVLTAGHCVSNDPLAAALHVYEGSRPTGRIFRVSAVVRYAVPLGEIPSEYRRLVQFSLDTARLRLSSPVRGHTPIPLATNRDALPSRLRIAGAGLSGRSAGMLRTTTLIPLKRTNTGVTIARAVGARICVGDSGGPVVVDGRRGPLLWGVASAVLTTEPSCGTIVIIAPARPDLNG